MKVITKPFLMSFLKEIREQLLGSVWKWMLFYLLIFLVLYVGVYFLMNQAFESLPSLIYFFLSFLVFGFVQHYIWKNLSTAKNKKILFTALVITYLMLAVHYIMWLIFPLSLYPWSLKLILSLQFPFFLLPLILFTFAGFLGDSWNFMYFAMEDLLLSPIAEIFMLVFSKIMHIFLTPIEQYLQIPILLILDMSSTSNEAFSLSIYDKLPGIFVLNVMVNVLLSTTLAIYLRKSFSRKAVFAIFSAIYIGSWLTLIAVFSLFLFLLYV